jgi:hypothetical protein
VANQLSPQMLAQLYGQESHDPFLFLVTLDHEEWDEPIYFVNNTVEIVSRGITYLPFPMTIRLPTDDGETARAFAMEFDNVSLELIEPLRKVTTQVDIKLEMILASMPDEVQISFEELKLQTVNYTKFRVIGSVILDNFLNTAMTSEQYGPSNFKGLF